jgi:hypothetical protein
MHGRTCTSGMACVCVRVVVGQVGRKPMFNKAKLAGHITHRHCTSGSICVAAVGEASTWHRVAQPLVIDHIFSGGH